MPFEFHTRRPLQLMAGLATVLTIAGCGSIPNVETLFGVITPYRIEVVQGNVVTKEMAALVKPGMTRAQVRDALGSPLLTDIFHVDRWDYVFTIRRQGAAYQQRRATAMFEGDTLKSFESDELPSELEFVASIDTQRKRGGTPPPLALNDEQIKALPAPAKVSPDASASAPAEGPVRSYPPLEAPR